MSLSNDLISQFVKATKDDKEQEKETTVYGKIVKIDGDEYVQLDGSELLTPVSSTTTVKDGERVTVMIKNHTAIVTGNISSPSASNNDLQDAVDQISEFEIVIADKVSTKDLDVEKARIDTLVADNVTIKEKLIATEASIGELEADNVTINEKLTAAEAEIDNLDATKISAEIADLNYAKVTDLEATNAKVVTIEGTYANFERVTTDKITALEANVKDLGAVDLTAMNADIINLKANKADIDDLTAENIKFESATGKTLNVQTVLSQFTSGENAQYLNLTSQNTTIGNAVIKNAMIDSVSVDKLTSGTINTNEINIASDDNSMKIEDGTIQFSDSNGKVRMQIGEDAQGDFNFILTGEDGTTTLIDENGIKEDAIADGLIKTDMINNNAITGDKINYASFVSGLNEDGTAQLISSSKVELDGKSLSVAFNTLESTVDNIQEDYDEKITTNTTNIDVINGQIDTLVSETTTLNSNINDLQGQITTVSNNYSSLKQTTDNINATVSSHTTSITEVNNKVDNVQTQASTNKSSIDMLNNQISLKVESSDVQNMININYNDINAQTKRNGNELIPQSYRYNSLEGFSFNHNGGNRITFQDGVMIFEGAEFLVSDFIPVDRTLPIYWRFEGYCTNARLYLGFERYNKDRNVCNDTENKATWYVITSRNVDGIYEGYYTESEFNDLAYIKLRLLVDWENLTSNSGVITTVKQISLRQLSNGYPQSLKTDYTNKIETVQNQVTTNSASIDLLTDQISLKVESSELQEVKNTITNEYTNAIQNVQTQVTTNTASIDMLTDQISLKVEADDVNRAISTIEGENLVVNGDFDTLYGWNKKDNFNIELDTGVGGGNCLKVIPSSKGSAYMMNSFPIRVIPNKKYKLSFYYKNTTDFNGTSDFAKVRIAKWTDDTHILSRTVNDIKTDWTYAEYIFTSPSDTDVLNIKICNNATIGNLWIDKIKIIDITADKNLETVQTQVNTNKSSIDLLKNQISLKVEQSDINTAVNTVTTNYTNAINNIQIGARNLLLDSERERSDSATNYLLQIANKELIKENIGEMVTVSFDAKTDFQHGTWDCYFRSSEGIIGPTPIPISEPFTSQYKRFKTSITIPEEVVDDLQTFAIRSNQYMGANTGLFSIRNVKLEFGNKATTWTPAPEDVDASIQTVQTQATTNAASIDMLTDQISLKVEQSDINTAVNTVTTNYTNAIKTVQNQVNTNKSSIDLLKNQISLKVEQSDINTAVNTVTTNYTNAIQTVQNQVTTNAASIDMLTDQIALKVDTSTMNSTLGSYAKSSDLTLTADQLKAEFKSTGGYNLIRNSTGLGGLSNWTTNATMASGYNKSIPSANAKYLCLDNGTTTSERYAFSKRFKLKPNTKYTLSGWFYMYDKCPSVDIWLLNSKDREESDTSTGYDYASRFVGNFTTTSTWTYHTWSITTQTDAITGYLRIDVNGYNANGTSAWNRFCWNSLMLNEGDAQPWTPHPSEVYEGNTTIDANGVTINNGAITIKNNAGQTQLEGDPNGNLTLNGSLYVVTEDNDRVWIGANASKVPDFATSNPNYQVGVFMGSQLVISDEYTAWSEGKAITEYTTLGKDRIHTTGTLSVDGTTNLGDKVTFGERQTTTAPATGSSTNYTPITITPPYHTRSWNHNIMDDANNSNYRFMYGTTATAVMTNTGDFRISRNFYENGTRVVQSGQANSGWYVRYSDGTQICWGGKWIGTLPMTSGLAGGVYGNTGASVNTSGFSLTFAANFASAPYVTADVKSTGYLICNAYGSGASTINIRLWSNYSTTYDGVEVNYVAMGRWK